MNTVDTEKDNIMKHVEKQRLWYVSWKIQYIILATKYIKMKLLRDSSTPVLCRKDAHWLKFQEFQICNFMYVLTYNVAYQY